MGPHYRIGRYYSAPCSDLVLAGDPTADTTPALNPSGVVPPPWESCCRHTTKFSRLGGQIGTQAQTVQG